MTTEARKTFGHGFALNEQELRRLVDTAVEQVRKAIPNDPVVLLQAKFRNGTVTDCSSVEELLTLENVGPKQIVRLRLFVDDGRDLEHAETKVAIVVRFTNLAEEDDERRSVIYIVKGEVRDWVLVTASELEDRIEKVKCVGVHALLGARKSPLLFALLVPLTTLVMLFGFMHALSDSPRSSLVKDAISSGQQLDAVKAIALLEQDSLKDRESITYVTLYRWAIGYPTVFALCVIVVGLLAGYLHPSYVFSWADYSKVYQRRLSIRNYVYVGIILALVIAVVGDIIVIKLGIR
jgi:hypothetical protein